MNDVKQNLEINMPSNENRATRTETMNIVIVGHVDHGKSTIVGRLLADTGSLPDGKLEQVKLNCERNSKPFEYAFLIDALKDEQSQGITIDSARVFFQTEKRRYIIIDAPGHIEFLKNMVTGASHAESALLVIDAKEGVRENSRRHGYMLAMLGIKQITVLVNKMDLVEYSQDVFDNIVKEYDEFLAEVGVKAASYIPVSGVFGDNIADAENNMSWYKGINVLKALDEFKKEEEESGKPFRMPVQDIYKFTKFGDDRRIIAGTVETGVAKPGDEIIFYPSGKKSRIHSIEAFGENKKNEIRAGDALGFTLSEQIYLTRGEIAAKEKETPPKVTSKIRVSMFWLGKKPLVKKKEYLLKLGTVKVPMKIQNVNKVLDASSLKIFENKQSVERHDVAECDLVLKRAIAFDLAHEISNTSRFVILDEYEIRGGGIIKEALIDDREDIREKVFLRNYKWEKSRISPEQRFERLNQKSSLIVITGEKDIGKKPLAKALESELFNQGKLVYFLGIANVLYGVDADIKDKPDVHKEHIRRLSEVAYLMLDMGAILIVTAIGLSQNDLELIKTVVSPEKIETIWVGENVTTDISYDFHLPENSDISQSVKLIKELLQEKGIIFKAW